jgi:hypothetical protein
MKERVDPQAVALSRIDMSKILSTITIELHRVLAEAEELGSHIHIPVAAFKATMIAVLGELKKLVAAAGGPEAILADAVQILETALAGGGVASIPAILMEVLEIIAKAIEAANSAPSAPSAPSA